MLKGAEAEPRLNLRNEYADVNLVQRLATRLSQTLFELQWSCSQNDIGRLTLSYALHKLLSFLGCADFVRKNGN
jgi:hypothetical protein